MISGLTVHLRLKAPSPGINSQTFIWSAITVHNTQSLFASSLPYGYCGSITDQLGHPTVILWYSTKPHNTLFLYHLLLKCFPLDLRVWWLNTVKWALHTCSLYQFILLHNLPVTCSECALHCTSQADNGYKIMILGKRITTYGCNSVNSTLISAITIRPRNTDAKSPMPIPTWHSSLLIHLLNIKSLYDCVCSRLSVSYTMLCKTVRVSSLGMIFARLYIRMCYIWLVEKRGRQENIAQRWWNMTPRQIDGPI